MTLEWDILFTNPTLPHQRHLPFVLFSSASQLFNLDPIDIHTRNGHLPIDAAIPAAEVVHVEIVPLKHHFTPTGVNPEGQNFGSAEGAAINGEKIVESIPIGGKSMGNEHLCRPAQSRAGHVVEVDRK